MISRFFFRFFLVSPDPTPLPSAQLRLILPLRPTGVFDIIESGRTSIIHYWAPWMGPETPLLSLLEGEAQRLEGEVSFHIVDSGFIHPEFSPDQLPLTVLYKSGASEGTASLDPSEVQDLIQRAQFP